MADHRAYSSSWYAPPTARHPGFPPRSTYTPTHAPRHGAAENRYETLERWLRPDTTGQIPVRTKTRRRLDANGWHWLLWLPILVPLWPGLYNRVHPTFGGLPFYY